MDTRKYEVIIKAAECGNLTKAGESFGYTQSGVSHMIKGVEEEFGFRIFMRGRDGVSLTTEGERVLPFLREVEREPRPDRQRHQRPHLRHAAHRFLYKHRHTLAAEDH